MNGSLQLNRYYSARRNGRSMMMAAVEAGIGIGEARLIEADEIRAAGAENRAPFALATSAAPDEQSAAPDPQPIPAPEPGAQSKEDDMPRGKKKEGTISGEVPKPDFDAVDRIYQTDIAPAKSEQMRKMKEVNDGWKEAKKAGHIHVGAARAAYNICKLEDAEQQAFLRTMHGVFTKRGVALRPDLADMAEGNDRDRTVVPIGEGKRPGLATIPPAVEGDVDLADEDHQQAAE